ncbi:MAG TPA: hypothetical protein VNE16_12255 [Vicinamibacterales bacterium]|nr:hypothetical protein [Vicinamibacterales bacterium]
MAETTQTHSGLHAPTGVPGDVWSGVRAAWWWYYYANQHEGAHRIA